MAETVRKNLGMVTAYAYAVSKGYTGTEEEFAELMASYADVAQDAEASAQAAAQSATTAEQKATQAAGSATNAAVSATSASESAQAAAGSSNSASLYAQNAGASATSAAGSASSASTYAGNASTSAQDAEGSANAAQESATQAAGSATTATAKAGEAATSATTAAEAAQRAEDAAATLVIDDTLTHAGQAADAKKTGDEIGELKANLAHIEDLTIIEQPKTTQLELTWTQGYYMDAAGRPQTNSGYSYSNQIPVQEGDIIEGSMRFMTAYDTTTTTIYNEFKTSITRYVVPPSVKYIVISSANSDRTKVRTITHISDVNIADTKINKLTTETSGVVSLRTTGNISGANSIELTTYFLRKGMSIAFYGKVTTLGAIKVGRGTSGINSAYFEIGATNVKYYGATTLFSTIEHTLTIEEYIFVLIDINSENAVPTITIYTKSGSFQYTYDNYQWLGANPALFASGDEATVLTDCELSFFGNDFKKPIWYFGDSYMVFRDSSRLPTWLIYPKVLKNLCSIGCSGASAAGIQPDFVKLFNGNNYPEYVVWAIGMNNNDSNGAINAVWKATTDNLISACNAVGVTLILCTIPNTPVVDNQYKNAYVRESGLRYIDYASAVNTSLTGTEWVDGALSSDNVHPTQIGARLLTSKLIADFPEICG